MTARGRATRTFRCAVTAGCGVLALLLAAAPVLGATRYDARLRFRSIRSAHFTVHYHQGEDAAARRVLALAEAEREALQRRTTLRAPAHTHVVLVDQNDASNGWSTPVPYPLIEIALAPPPPQSFLGNHDDWLRTVFAHEYAHVVHLDQVEGWMRVFRWLLGRHPLSFPNLAVPSWQIEGFATYIEGASTGLGRAHAAEVAAVTSAQLGGPRPLDLSGIGGGLVRWPWGHAPYFFGGRFYDYLAAQHGDRAIGELARETARHFPYLGLGAFTPVFGKRAEDLWSGFVASAQPAAARPPEDGADPSRELTQAGYLASCPRFDRTGGASAGAAGVSYARLTPDGFASVRSMAADGSRDRRLTHRFGGDTVAPDGAWLLFDSLEFDGPVAQYSDVYAVNRDTRERRRLTRGARLAEPDVSPDRTRLAAVASADGDKDLVVLRLSHDAEGAPRLDSREERRVSRQGCTFATPRWAPDGRTLAASLHCRGELPQIVLVHPDEGRVTGLASAARSRSVTPAWAPDGRRVYFASDRHAGPFALFAVEIDPIAGTATSDAARILTRPGGVMWPDVDATGRQVVYLSATPGGLDVFVAPLPPVPDGTTAAESPATLAEPASQGGDRAMIDPASRPYSPWSSLLPRAWLPYVTAGSDRVDVGAVVTGSDALGRHSYALSASFPAKKEPVSEGFPSSTQPDWRVSYAYDRWRPTLFLDAAQTVDAVGVRAATAVEPLSAERRTRSFAAGLVWPVRRMRWGQNVLLSAVLQDERIALPGGPYTRDRNGLRAGWSVVSAREFGYSVSPESGVRFSTTLEHVSPDLGADGTATSATGDFRAYLPGGLRHAVVAVRAAAGASSGDRTVRRQFTNGGSRASTLLFPFSDGAVGLVRGFAHDAIAGAAAVSASVDYRLPLFRVERGLGLWPAFANSIHGAVFADVGSTGDSIGSLDAPIWSTGAECAATLTIGYGYRVSVAAGVAWTQQPGRTPESGRAAAYVRTGYAF